MEPKRTNKRKSECTKEEWDSYREYMRLYYINNSEKEKQRRKEYNSRPEVKERRKARDSTLEANARRRAYARTEEAKQKARELFVQKKNDKERWSKILSNQRRRRTGMTEKLFDALLIFQENKCAICKRSFNGKQIRRDHCHETNSPRGLLCHHCNIMEGMLKSMQLSPEEFAHRLSDYLIHHPVSKLDQTTLASVLSS